MGQDDKTGGQAIYRQIEMRLRGSISQGEWRPGVMLPSRRELAKRYGVSSLTIERAVSALISDGLLRADDRRGTFVAERKPEEVSQAVGLSREPLGEQTIAIIGSLYTYRHDHLELNNEVVKLLIHSLESAMAADSNRTCFFNRARGLCDTVQPLRQAVADACDAGVSAIVIIGLGVASDEIEDALDGYFARRERPPLVVISAGAAIDRPVSHVLYDNSAAGYDAAAHLLAAGCRRLMIFAPATSDWAAQRIAGIRAASLHAAGGADELVIVPDDPEPWVQDHDPEELAYLRARELLRGIAVPSGVICLQDQTAYGFIRAAQEVGLSPGRDFAIAAFDDNPHSRIIRLTSMRPPVEAMGVEAARLVQKALRGENACCEVKLRWNLIPRASTDITKRTVSMNIDRRGLASTREA
ncbi:MAG: GntR family transcriptional regulator [Capsulimonadaceae bacterium]|nr:GntR family transcriptional regulator [Capsulimonadaceae bacterium]